MDPNINFKKISIPEYETKLITTNIHDYVYKLREDLNKSRAEICKLR